MNVLAVRFLEDQLMNGPVPTNELYAEGAKRGFSDATLRRAAKHAGPNGAEQRKVGFDSSRWEWFLVPPPEPVVIRGKTIHYDRYYSKKGRRILGADYIAAYRAYLLNNNGVDPKA